MMINSMMIRARTFKPYDDDGGGDDDDALIIHDDKCYADFM